MTSLPYLAGSYALGLLLPAAFAVSAWARVRAAARRLAAIDPRARRRAAGRS